MKTCRINETTPTPRVVALGSFDGVHYAHRAVLSAARTKADLLHVTATAFTFTTDPSFLLGRPQKMLQSFAERETHLAATGIDETVYTDFDGTMRQTSPEEFYCLLKERLTPVALVCGYNYTFGEQGKGNVALLRQLCQKDGVDCVVLDPVKLGDFTVSSTVIRTLIEKGEISAANRLLGYSYGFSATVIRGQGMGHAFGYPTINQPLPEDRATPAYGVYLSLVNIDGVDHPAVTDVGVKPTVTVDSLPTAESFLLNFDGDLYGKTVRLSLLQYLREERCFANVDALTAQIGEDIRQARLYFDE